MFVCCGYCVLSGRGLCDELITRPEESYRLWCVVVCDLENLRNEEAMTRVGSQRHGWGGVIRNQYITYLLHSFFFNLTPFPLTLVGDMAIWLSYSDSAMSKL
jgi:hypothetical protein